MKRFERPMLGFLSRDEMLAVIGTPSNSWISRRDHLLLGLLYNTGARVSEIIGIRVADVVLALLPNRDGEAMTRDNVTKRLALAVATAARTNAALANRRITPHTVRHYLPFLTLSCKADGWQARSFENCRSWRWHDQAITRHSFQDLQTVQEAKELVPRLIASWFAVRRRRLCKCLLLHRERRFEIDLRGLHRFVSEPQCNHGAVNPRL